MRPAIGIVRGPSLYRHPCRKCGEGIPVGRIAREFGVSRTTLRSAVLGFTWKWLWNSAA